MLYSPPAALGDERLAVRSARLRDAHLRKRPQGFRRPRRLARHQVADLFGQPAREQQEFVLALSEDTRQPVDHLFRRPNTPTLDS